MEGGAKIEGFDNVVSNLNKQIAKIKGVTMAGLIKSAIVIRRDMDITPPLIPVDVGNLRGSWTVVTMYDQHGPAVLIGFTANYAVFVHENMMAVNWNRPGSGPKFFEASIKRNSKKVLKIIQENVKLD